MKLAKMLAGIVAATVLAAACDGATSTASRAAGTAAPAGGPSLDFGSTASVVVHCPPNLQNVQSGECVAYGVDAHGRYTTGSGAAWSTSTSWLVSVNSGGIVTAATTGVGTATVSATIGGITGSANIPIRYIETLAVAVNGQSPIKANNYCVYAASASGGSGSYTYSWSAPSPAVGTASGGEWIGKSPADFTLSVTVSDGFTSVTNSRNVTISSGAGTCPL
jgi:hypothetical protein